MTPRQIFTPPLTVEVTHTISLTYVGRVDVPSGTAINGQVCDGCGQVVGAARPLGDAWGIPSQGAPPQALRLCHACYTRVLDVARKAAPQEEAPRAT